MSTLLLKKVETRVQHTFGNFASRFFCKNLPTFFPLLERRGGVNSNPSVTRRRTVDPAGMLPKLYHVHVRK